MANDYEIYSFPKHYDDEMVTCPSCNGTGKSKTSDKWPCDYCHGTGRVVNAYKLSSNPHL